MATAGDGQRVQMFEGFGGPEVIATPTAFGRVALAFVGIAAVLFGGWLWLRPQEVAPEVVDEDDGRIWDATELIGPDDALPSLAEGEMPEVTEHVGLAPTIVTRVQLDDRGGVVEARVFRRRPELVAFEEVAVNAVRGFRFSPARKDGQPVPAWFNYPVVFRDASGKAEVTLRVKGSDTIGGALAPLLARAYRTVHPKVNVDVEALGSSTAFTGLLDGTADIGTSSRNVQPSELERAKKRDVVFSEFVIGFDGIAVIVHPDNPVRELSLAHVGEIYSGKISKWEVLDGNDAPIRRLSRPTQSGTHSLFKASVLSDGELAPDTEVIEHSEDIVAAVAGDPNAIGYVGLGWTSSRVRTVALSDGGAAVLPTAASVNDGSYPMFRPLFMYTRGTPSREIADFLRFVVSPAGQKLVVEAGFLARSTALDIPSGDDHSTEAEPTRIYFAENSVKLDAAARGEIERLVARLKSVPSYRLLLVPAAEATTVVRTEDMPTTRGQNVMERLVAAGVPADRIELDVVGSKPPQSAFASAGTRAATRRVDVFVVAAPPATTTAPKADAQKDAAVAPVAPETPAKPAKPRKPAAKWVKRAKRPDAAPEKPQSSGMGPL
jgi:phosphate transport system substrate-binding protein